MSPKIIIAIDGLAATGKGTLSKKIAETLNLAHLDTGSLYRATALNILNAGGDPEDQKTATQTARDLIQQIKQDPDLLQNPDLRLPNVALAAATVSKIQEVRGVLLDLQRDFAANPGEGFNGAVLDGRDIGTIICPDADVKFFVTAQPEIRADRRHKELQLAGKSVTYPQVLEEMQERDLRDTTRKAAPTQAAPDAIIIDTSDLNAADVLELALKHIRATHQI